VNGDEPITPDTLFPIVSGPWLASSAELIGAVVTIVTLAFLVPTIGVTGAALSSLLAYATQTTLLGYGLRQIHVDGGRP
jgi:O-antigen/teichoic acid export membrane protein